MWIKQALLRLYVLVGLLAFMLAVAMPGRGMSQEVSPLQVEAWFQQGMAAVEEGRFLRCGVFSRLIQAWCGCGWSWRGPIT